ncbi:MAG: GNAT family N-acetyltransferase [Planctomycetes bacterium]|nr:GNAT family N-acetyltransferase [Planctomycetota bacterium]
MRLHLRTDYWDDRLARAEFQAFIRRIHHLDFMLWQDMGCWDPLYRPFSYFAGDRLVASTCLYSMDMTIQGERRRVAQISGVGTLPEFRRRGLNRRLTEAALEWARPDHDFVYLFADEEAFPFYAATGFRPVQEQFARFRAPAVRPRPARQPVDPADPGQLARLRRMAERRAPVSRDLGVLNVELLLFHALYPLRELLSFVPELEVYVAFARDETGLRLFDVIGEHVPAFEEIWPFLSEGRAETVDFQFMPDRMDLDGLEWLPLEGNGTHLMGEFPLESGPFVFPFTAHA